MLRKDNVLPLLPEKCGKTGLFFPGGRRAVVGVGPALQTSQRWWRKDKGKEGGVQGVGWLHGHTPALHCALALHSGGQPLFPPTLSFLFIPSTLAFARTEPLRLHLNSCPFSAQPCEYAHIPHPQGHTAAFFNVVGSISPGVSATRRGSLPR